jgi:MmyB-like transcription regulator ligand binding domain
MLALSPRFAQMWAEHEVEVRGPMLKHVTHPQAGPLEFECQMLHIAETGQRLIAYCAAPGSVTEAAFRELAACAAGPSPASAGQILPGPGVNEMKSRAARGSIGGRSQPRMSEDNEHGL